MDFSFACLSNPGVNKVQLAATTLQPNDRQIKVNKWTQKLIQSDPHQHPNTKGKERQKQLSSHQMNRRQAELATLSQKMTTLLSKLNWIYL